MALTSDRGSGGLGTPGYQPIQPEVSLEELTRASEAVQLRTTDDIVKSLALDEEALSQLPKARQPQSLRSVLLPYQLQVCNSHQSPFAPLGCKTNRVERGLRGW